MVLENFELVCDLMQEISDKERRIKDLEIPDYICEPDVRLIIDAPKRTPTRRGFVVTPEIKTAIAESIEKEKKQLNEEIEICKTKIAEL